MNRAMLTHVYDNGGSAKVCATKTSLSVTSVGCSRNDKMLGIRTYEGRSVLVADEKDGVYHPGTD